MIRLAADEDFNGIIVRGLRRRFPSLDFVRARDSGLAGSADEAILEWAAREERLLLTHDVTTLIAKAYARLDPRVSPKWCSRWCSPLGCSALRLVLAAHGGGDIVIVGGLDRT